MWSTKRASARLFKANQKQMPPRSSGVFAAQIRHHLGARSTNLKSIIWQNLLFPQEGKIFFHPRLLFVWPPVPALPTTHRPI